MRNGVSIPLLGLGTFRAEKEETYRAVRWAVEVGYRLIDTARDYGNEPSVGQAVRECGVAREELFVTTKLSNADCYAGRTKQAFFDTLKTMGLDYLDLYLIHWPVPGYLQAWKELEELYSDGLIRAIGVCNCHPEHLAALERSAAVTPMINQVEMHPQLAQKALRGYCANRGIVCQAWSPLGGDGAGLLQHPIIQDIAEKRQRTSAQIVLTWAIQQGIIAIPKSTHRDRITSNFDVLGFSLEVEDMQRLGALNRNRRTGPHPDEIAGAFHK